ncbi:MAG: DNA alkylation repair protein [archaeon]
MLSDLKEDLEKLASSEKAEVLSGFFKTGKGQYAEGDKFIGVMVPFQRRIAKKYMDLPMFDLQELISSDIHEHRLTAVFILIAKYEKTCDRSFVDFYLKNLKYINNWDLVDLSAPKILGHYLLEDKRDILYRLVKSKSLWERRVAVLSTFAFIKKGDFGDALNISELLLKDRHDLIHKAVGWMLREVGKRNQEVEEQFLNKYYKRMSRTMLRYSIERFSSEKKQFYMKK